MNREDRKAAVAAYKERKSLAGVFSIRCEPTGQLWLGTSPDVDAIWNRLSFMLRQGNERRRALQEAWTAHGAEAFVFTVLERVDGERLQFGRDRVLRERLDCWMGAVGGVAF